MALNRLNGKMRIMKKNAFTLIELLVVISIIALLLSILLPGLQKAKEVARDVVCRSHVKGIGLAIQVYLDDNDSRAYNNRKTNHHLWLDDNGKYITPTTVTSVGSDWWKEAYWALGYREYAESDDVFGCPSFVLTDIAKLLYAGNKYYNASRTDLKNASGYGLNSYFFIDPKASSESPYIHNRKTTSVKSPSRFIVIHDHVEPKMEGEGQGDMFYINDGDSFGLTKYRTPGSRSKYYESIFRHRKKNKGWDDPSQHATRIPLMDENPNGSANVLFLDGSVDFIRETTGKNIPRNIYIGEN